MLMQSEQGNLLGERLAGVARTAQQIAAEMRSLLEPDELVLEMGIKWPGR